MLTQKSEPAVFPEIFWEGMKAIPEIAVEIEPTWWRCKNVLTKKAVEALQRLRTNFVRLSGYFLGQVSSRTQFVSFCFYGNRSEGVTCGICMEPVKEKANPTERRFGILCKYSNEQL